MLPLFISKGADDQNFTVAEFSCLTGWAVLQRHSKGYTARVWSKESGEDSFTFGLDEGKDATKRHEQNCRNLMREIRANM